MSELPIGWATAPLGEIACVRLGKMLDRKRTRGARFPYLRNINVRWGTIETDDLLSMHFQDAELERFSVRPNDVLVCEGGEPGRAAVWRNPASKIKYQKALHRVRTSGAFLPDWLVHQLYLDAHHGSLTRFFTGTTIKHFTLTAIREYELRVPPLPEQHRIVEALDSYLTRLDSAEKALRRAEANLQRYRASVLKAAVEGKLVPTEAELAKAEGRDYEPASALLERILIERRRRWEEAELAKMEAQGKSPKNDAWKKKYKAPPAPDSSALPELPEGWCWASLDSLLIAIDAGKSFKCEERPPRADEVGIVKVSAVTWGRFNEDESKTCNRPEMINEDFLIAPGDFLISRANTINLVGAVVIVGSISRQLMLSDKILRLRLAGQLEVWLVAVLRSQMGRQQIENLATGNQDSMRNIGQARLRQIAVPIPPKAEATRILGMLESAGTADSRTSQTVGLTLPRLGRLRQSILQWAFEGKLVDQDPNDEPASLLLKRIRSEREVQAKTKPRRKRKQPRGKAQKELFAG